MTEPRPMKVFDPREDLNNLCDKLVGGRQSSQHKTQKRPEKIVRQFDKVLRQRGISNLVRRDVSIEIPLFHQTEIFPFCFQNGQPNLIKPAVFGSDENRTIANACRLAVEGLSVHNYKLNVIAGFEGEKETNRQTVQDLLRKYDVNLYFDSQVDEFVDFIERTAHR